ncbi:MAG: hypothetical protein KGL79_05445, partial [Acidobacteriota bacterium]|nr:hypothetical protein [Acidobacteriota bacterium]
MRYVLYAVLVVVALVAARRRRARASSTPVEARRAIYEMPFVRGRVGIVAAREVRERLRGRMFRVGTVLILAVVAAAIVIPNLHHRHAAALRVGVVGELPANLRAQITRDAR